MAALAVAVAATTSLARRRPALALGLVWVIGAWQLFSETQMMFVELALVAVAFGTARWGSVATVVAGGLSIPAGTAIALFALTYFDYGGRSLMRARPTLFETFYAISDTWVVGVAVVALASSACPGWPGWPCGSRHGPATRAPPRWWPRSRPRRPCARPTRRARSPSCATRRLGWPATCTTPSVTRSR